MLQLVSAMGFAAFQTAFPAPPSRKRLTDGWADEAIPAPGFIPPEESPLSAAASHHCDRCPLAVGSAPRRAPKNATIRTSKLALEMAPKRTNTAEAASLGASTSSRCSLFVQSPTRKRAVFACRGTGPQKRPDSDQNVRDVPQAEPTPKHRNRRSTEVDSRDPSLLAIPGPRSESRVETRAHHRPRSLARANM